MKIQICFAYMFSLTWYQEANNVRGVLLDMSQVTEKIDLESMAFTNMDNLRYLKIFDSCCPRQCKTKCIHVPNGFKFPLKEVRYFHWVKFPLEELPPDFSPGTLVDLRLPYSKIERVWKGVKVCFHVPSFCCYFFI